MLKRIVTFVACCTVIAGVAAAAYFLYLRDNVSWFQQYRGTITGVFETPDPEKIQFSPHAKESQFNSQFWEIELDNGRSMRVKVPRGLWNQGGVGREVAKLFGRRYPAIVVHERQPEIAPMPSTPATGPLPSAPVAQ